MDKPVFKNRPNALHKLPDGRELWESRSPAVVGVVLGIVNDSIFVLAEKRSATMTDAPNKWAVPSGYMDWDEDGFESLIRELYEETSFYVPKFANKLIFDNDEQPFYVQTSPTENRQNIALNYCFIYDFSGGLPKYVEKFKDKEIAEIKWIEISEVVSGKYQWAFEHDKRIEMAVEKFQKYLT